MLAGLEPLEPLVGAWRIEASVPRFDEVPDAAGRAVYEPGVDGAVLFQRTKIDIPEAPDSLGVITPDAAGDDFTLHYFDTRGVVRLYAMTFDGRTWTQKRTAPDFSPLSFCQRFRGTPSQDGQTITARWEMAEDCATWELDIELLYTREG